MDKSTKISIEATSEDCGGPVVLKAGDIESEVHVAQSAQITK